MDAGKEFRPVMLEERREKARLQALADLQVTEGGPEEMFDRIARLVKAALKFPLAYVSLIEFDRQIIKTHTDGVFCDGSRDTAFCSSTIEANQPLIIADTFADARFSTFPLVIGPPGVRSYWGVPLTTRTGFNVGALCVLDHVSRTPDARDLAVLQDFGRLTMECMELRAQATTDILTGLNNRRAFFAEAGRAFREARGMKLPLSCVLVDLDRFKRINDTFGHATGDRVLRNLGKLLLQELEATSVAGRIGGEEFAIVVRRPLAQAIGTAEHLRKLLAEHLSTIVPDCTASFGVAEQKETDGSLDDLVRRADEEVYEAKKAGRNCTRPQLDCARQGRRASVLLGKLNC